MAEKFPLKEFIMGILSELNAGVKREPIAYLYNGVRLPALPEWDRETYPFAVIVKYDDDIVATQYYLAFYATQADYDADYAYATKFWVQPCVKYLTRGTYQEWESMTQDYVYATSEEVLIWANHDILYKGSTEVCRAASDPIPVYE